MADVPDEDDDPFAPKVLASWLRVELRELAKVLELRTNEATNLVTLYLEGAIDREEVKRRQDLYIARWGDGPFGKPVIFKEDTTDEEILMQIDRAVAGNLLSYEEMVALTRKGNKGPGPSRS